MAGGSTRQEGEDRIGFLARVRNKVLEPLWWPQNITKQQVTQPGDGQVIYSSFSDNITTTTLSSGSSSGGRRHSKQWLFKADKVVFLNDVYFCAQHVHRLLAHEGVNLACGLDHYLARTAQKLPVSWRMDVRGLQVCHATRPTAPPFVSVTSPCSGTALSNLANDCVASVAWLGNPKALSPSAYCDDHYGVA